MVYAGVGVYGVNKYRYMWCIRVYGAYCFGCILCMQVLVFTCVGVYRCWCVCGVKV